MPGTNTTPTVSHQIVSISVDLGVTTPDNLRHIDFGLQKNTDCGTVTWTINFKFQERTDATASFVDVVTLSVTVKSKDQPAAEATAKDGLSPAQVDHLNGPVTAVSKLYQKDQATSDQVSHLVEATIPKHDA